ncbi:hypothetical protein [Amaricoccus solimangrovi]|uniref:Uncharacterized protein n=1 Tax=Amaricoccus solimangrovi TaxID=2589815 RepID=A0A501WH80_9RHOB|nr:hypothetical protein [Amaricoccus solimangrovi]TPE49243.1 hypothetical protein FJM51_15280 [Amaricoccus solimangrovi]
MNTGHASLARWKLRHTVVVVIGILLNLAYCFPLLVAPDWTLALFGIPREGTTFWPRLVGGLLILISTFYVPMTVDLDRYRIFAWLSILPSRTFGATFLFVAVLGFGFAGGFLVPALIDAGIAIASLYCMIHVVRIEQALATGRSVR